MRLQWLLKSSIGKRVQSRNWLAEQLWDVTGLGDNPASHARCPKTFQCSMRKRGSLSARRVCLAGHGHGERRNHLKREKPDNCGRYTGSPVHSPSARCIQRRPARRLLYMWSFQTSGDIPAFAVSRMVTTRRIGASQVVRLRACQFALGLCRVAPDPVHPMGERIGQAGGHDRQPSASAPRRFLHACTGPATREETSVSTPAQTRSARSTIARNDTPNRQHGTSDLNGLYGRFVNGMSSGPARNPRR